MSEQGNNDEENNNINENKENVQEEMHDEEKEEKEGDIMNPNEIIGKKSENDNKDEPKEENEEKENKDVTDDVENNNINNDEFFNNKGIDAILNQGNKDKPIENNENQVENNNENNNLDIYSPPKDPIVIDDPKNKTNFSNASLFSINKKEEEQPKEEEVPKIEEPKEEEDNIEIFKEPYKYPKNLKQGKIRRSLEEYNKIKETIKKLFNRPEPTTDSATTKDINSMLNLLDYLNVILDVIIEHQKFPKYKNPIRKSKEEDEIKREKVQEQSNEKLVQVYKKQYEKVKQRLAEVSKEDYIKTLTEKMQKLNEDISNIQKDNRQLKTNQIISENLFKKKINSDSIANHLSKLMSECNKHKADCENVTIKIQKNLEIIKKNDEKIKKLENDLKEIDRQAHEQFHFSDYDDVKKEKSKNSKKQKIISKLRKQIEVYQHALVSNQAKYEIIGNKNQEHIEQLESDKEGLAELLKIKQDELDLMKKNEIILHPEKVETGYPIKPEPQLPKWEPITNTSEIINTNQSSRIKKEEVLEQLKKKQQEEEALHNRSQDITGTNTSIVLKNIPLKPNFSFSHSKLNDNLKSMQKNKTLDDVFRPNEIKEDIISDEVIPEKEDPKEVEVKEEIKVEDSIKVEEEKKIESPVDKGRIKVLNTVMIGEEDLVSRRMTDENNDIVNQNRVIPYDSDPNEHELIIDDKLEVHSNDKEITPIKDKQLEDLISEKSSEQKKLPPLIVNRPQQPKENLVKQKLPSIIPGKQPLDNKKKFQEDEEVIEEVQL